MNTGGIKFSLRSKEILLNVWHNQHYKILMVKLSTAVLNISHEKIASIRLDSQYIGISTI